MGEMLYADYADRDCLFRKRCLRSPRPVGYHRLLYPPVCVCMSDGWVWGWWAGGWIFVYDNVPLCFSLSCRSMASPNYSFSYTFANIPLHLSQHRQLSVEIQTIKSYVVQPDPKAKLCAGRSNQTETASLDRIHMPGRCRCDHPASAQQ